MVKTVKKKINEILKKLDSLNLKNSEYSLIKKAIYFATKHHKGQLRKSGEPFIIHPLNVAAILIDWNMDCHTICAGILHDIIEDTKVSEDQVREQFGSEIADLVKAVTKISMYSSQNRSKNVYGNNREKYLIQVFLSMSKDLRVMFIKIADRYHNMKTIQFLKKDKQKRISLETQEIYANIAGRLGMYKIKNELLDICMKILNPSTYNHIKKIIDTRVIEYQDTFNEVIEKVQNTLNSKGIEYNLSSRVKSVFSTNEKMPNNEDIPDLFGIRIIVNEPLECYIILGIIHSLFFNLRNSFKDFISTPKINLYQSLHTVIFYKKMNIEFQIRTFEMDRLANFGVASHWQYKERYNPFYDEIKNTTLNDINVNEISNTERLNTIKKIAKRKYINIFNENKDIWENINENINLFEYAILSDSNRFMYLSNVYVNGKVAALSSSIDSGDIIKIEYAKDKTIKKFWIHYTKDTKMKKVVQDELDIIHSNIENDVSTFISNINKKLHTNYNKKTIGDFISQTFQINDIKEFMDDLKIIKFPQVDIIKLFASDVATSDEIIKKIKSKSWKWVWENSMFKANNEILTNEIVITKCCSKIPPNAVVGILKESKLEVHKFGCSKIDKNDKILVLVWDKDKIKKFNRAFRANIKITGNFNANTSTSIITAIQKYKTTISSFVLNKDKTDKTYNCDLILYVKNYSNLEKLMNELMNKSIINSWQLI